MEEGGGISELELGRETRLVWGVCVRDIINAMDFLSELGWRVVASGNTNLSTWLWGEL